MRTQDLENLNVGDYLEIEGRETTENGGGLVAFNIESDDDSDLELEGRISSLTATSVTMMGLELLVVNASGVDLAGFQEGGKVEIKYENVGSEYHIVAIKEDN
jgi:hypothetical protein